MSKKVFDVCWTMYRSNTTFDFIDFVVSKNSKSFFYYLLKFPITKILILVVGRIIGRDIYRFFYIKLLKGYSFQYLNGLSRDFYYDFLVNKKINYTFDLFNQFSDKDEVILCSASLDIIVEQIATQLKVRYVASKLCFANNICTGLLDSDLLGNKLELFEMDKIDLVVTDNLSDLELVKNSKRAVILSTTKNVNYWNSRGFTVDYLLEN